MPRLLDLFCGAGGAAMGYHRAGFDVVGVDVHPQPNYPFNFRQADALEVLADAALLATFDAVHASPPCQAYSVLRNTRPNAPAAPDLVAEVRDALERSAAPWVIENVPGAPLRPLIILCGSMFGLGAGGRQLRRHRLFESNVALLQPQCQHAGEAVGVYGSSYTGRYTNSPGTIAADPYKRRGAYQGTVAEKLEAMGVDWMTRLEVNQAIPPAYTEHIGQFLIRAGRASR